MIMTTSSISAGQILEHRKPLAYSMVQVASNCVPMWASFPYRFPDEDNMDKQDSDDVNIQIITDCFKQGIILGYNFASRLILSQRLHFLPHLKLCDHCFVNNLSNYAGQSCILPLSLNTKATSILQSDHYLEEHPS